MNPQAAPPLRTAVAIDPATEAGYLDALVEGFIAGDRKARPFIKLLTQTASFRRGL